MALPNVRPMAKRPWRVTESTYPINTKFLRLRKDTIELPNGEVIRDYFVRESRGYVIVCAVTRAAEIVLVRQYKHGIGQSILELPAGAIDPDESPQDCATRELREETGFTASDMRFIRTFVTDPTSSNSVAHLFFAPGAERTAPQDLDVTEDIVVEVVPTSAVREWIREGAINCIPHVGALYLLFDLGFIP